MKCQSLILLIFLLLFSDDDTGSLVRMMPDGKADTIATSDGES